MEIKLDSKIQFIKGVGPKMAQKFNKLGVLTVLDLIHFYPRTYKDYTKIIKIGDIEMSRPQSQGDSFGGQANNQPETPERSDGGRGKYQNEIPPSLIAGRDDNNNYTISGNIVGINNKRTSRRRFTVTEAVVEDGTGSIKVVWFNQPFLQKMLKAGSKVILNGKITRAPYSNILQMESPDRANRASIVPIYPETVGITSRYIAKIVSCIMYQVSSIKEYLPTNIINENNLMGIDETLKEIHLPRNSQVLSEAKRRMAFDELFFIALKAKLSRYEIKNENAPALNIESKKLKEFTDKLPFKLTDDQKRASWQIIKEISNDVPMNRLLNGDVGSGKTVVAAFAAFVTVLAKNRAIIMAPTEILANQHFENLKEILGAHKIDVGLMTANNKIDLDAKVLVGTHALIQDKASHKNIGLVVVDEQHRFGVKQRAKIKSFRSGELRPHFLSMTATPIPRTMQLALFGDLDVSVIKEMPKGRIKIETEYVDEPDRNSKYKFIKNQIRAGRQAFVVCPLIEEEAHTELLHKKDTEMKSLFDLDRKSVVREYKKLNDEVFPNLKIGMLHGKLKSKEKDNIMNQFSNNKLDILVSTSVVEVGVDIPNASVMMVEDAERFGLAQLHQFRGRVGRGEHKSYCLLFSSSKNPKAVERLRTLERVNDGFKLAREDLKVRGPGEIYGTMQSGDLDIRFANLSDATLISQASKSAKDLVVNDPKLEKYEIIREKLKDFLESKHLE